MSQIDETPLEERKFLDTQVSEVLLGVTKTEMKKLADRRFLCSIRTAKNSGFGVISAEGEFPSEALGNAIARLRNAIHERALLELPF